MKRIILSLSLIVLALTVVAGATRAIFTSQATVTGNTFATGILQIMVRSGSGTGSSISGISIENAAPGQCMNGQFAVLNYNAGNFGGLSTLPAKELVISVANPTGDSGLYSALTISVGANRGWPDWMSVYSGALSGLSEANLLSPRWTDLPAGWSEDVQYSVCLPTTASDTLQGKSTSFDLRVNAYDPHR